MRISTLPRAQAVPLLILIAAFLEIVHLFTQSTNCVQCAAVLHLTSMRLVIYGWLEATIAICILHRMRDIWRELWKREEDPPDVSGPEIHTAHYQHTLPIAELIERCTGILEKQFARPYNFQQMRARNVVYSLYAAKGLPFLFSPPILHAGVFFIILPVIMSFLVPEASRDLFLLCAGGGLSLFVTGFCIHSLSLRRKVWIQFAEIEGTVYATIILRSQRGICRSGRRNKARWAFLEGLIHRGMIEEQRLVQHK